MKLIEIAEKIDKSTKNEDHLDTTHLGNEFGIDVPYVHQPDRLKCYWVGYWLCTDTYVGYRMYFFDDEPVAFSVQKGRKCSEDFHWFSLELATKVKDYLLSLIIEEDTMDVSVCDINEDIGDDFQISFNCQIINKDKVTYNGEEVKLIERIKNKPYGIDTTHKIELPNGEIKTVEVEELNFGFHLNHSPVK